MKPDWKDALEWANWMWLGLSGNWFFGYAKPKWSWFLFAYKVPTTTKWDAAGLKFYALDYGWKARRASAEKRP